MSSVAAIEARLALPFNDPLLRVNEKPGGLRVFSAGGTLSHRRKK